LDIIALCISEISDWLNIILHPGIIGIPLEDFHLFQIFAMVACDRIWHSRNKAHHDGWIPNALSISADVNGLSLLLFASKLIMIQQSEGISQRKQLFVEILQVLLFKF